MAASILLGLDRCKMDVIGPGRLCGSSHVYRNDEVVTGCRQGSLWCSQLIVQQRHDSGMPESSFSLHVLNHVIADATSCVLNELLGEIGHHFGRRA
jgi:hypothetical protein